MHTEIFSVDAQNPVKVVFDKDLPGIYEKKVIARDYYEDDSVYVTSEGSARIKVYKEDDTILIKYNPEQEFFREFDLKSIVVIAPHRVAVESNNNDVVIKKE